MQQIVYVLNSLSFAVNMFLSIDRGNTNNIVDILHNISKKVISTNAMSLAY